MATQGVTGEQLDSKAVPGPAWGLGILRHLHHLHGSLGPALRSSRLQPGRQQRRGKAAAHAPAPGGSGPLQRRDGLLALKNNFIF